jgi:N-acetylated-alpha-linked acidic dipeptidase
LYAKNGSAAGRLVYAHFGRSEDYAALAKASVDVTQCVVLVRMGGDISLPAKVVLAAKHGAIGVLTYQYVSLSWVLSTSLHTDGLILLYSDPFDDGAARGKSYPDGPWRVSSEASFGSVYMGNGDPSTPDGSSGYAEDRISVDEVFSSNNTYNLVPQVVSMPISATVAGELLLRLSLSSNTSTMPTATDVFTATSWHGGAAVNGNAAPYRVGPSDFTVSLENKNKYTLKKVWNVLITVPGSREADRYVMVGAQRDALNAGAVSPGSGNAVFIEMLRAIGDLLTNGWVPHRTLLFASFDGEQFGSVGSSEWIDRHFSHLGGRGVVYLHLRDVVRGAGALQCEAAASLRKNIYRLATEIVQPKAQVAVASFFSGGVIAKTVETPDTDTSSESQLPTHQPHHRLLASEEETGTDEINDSDVDAEALPLNNKTFSHEVLKDSGASVFSYWLADTRKQAPTAKLPHIDLPGSDNKISPFLARLGIPSLELGFSGGYFGVEGTRSDSLEWVKKFADPNFLFHRAAAQLYGSIMLSFSDSLFLQYDFIEVARDLRRGEAYLLTALQREARSTQLQAAVMNRLALSIKEFEEAAVEVTTELKEMRDAMVNLISGELVVDLKKVREMNTRLLMTEKAFMLPAGLPKMPWLKHVRMQLGEVT